jgi:hypothetical protein
MGIFLLIAAGAGAWWYYDQQQKAAGFSGRFVSEGGTRVFWRVQRVQGFAGFEGQISNDGIDFRTVVTGEDARNVKLLTLEHIALSFPG